MLCAVKRERCQLCECDVVDAQSVDCCKQFEECFQCQVPIILLSGKKNMREGKANENVPAGSQSINLNTIHPWSCVE